MKIRELLIEEGRDHEPEIELALVIADRAFHIDPIINALNTGKIVVCDRYSDSTWAYQGWARGLPIKMVEDFISAVCKGTIPDVTYYLQVSPDVGLARVNKRPGKNSRFDNGDYEFHLRLYAGFDKLAERYPERIITIDADQAPEQIASDIWSDFTSRFLEGG